MKPVDMRTGGETSQTSSFFELFKNIALGTPVDNGVRIRYLTNRIDPGYHLTIAYLEYPDSQVFGPQSGLIPSDMQFPIIAVQLWHEIRQNIVKSPWGTVPATARGADGHTYQFYNIYFLDSLGHASRLEVVEYTAHSDELDMLSFVPDPLQSRQADFDHEDTATFQSIFDGVHDGEFYLWDSQQLFSLK
ncbi:hypothetical protein HY408_02040 [Candidatus Gottesmanbacteria bacterium]|nr:hypothetical protein [Candidatus Gottesmanbacteria bacterium]